MQKWYYFSMGLMVGIVAVLLTIIIMQNHQMEAYAAQGATSGGGAGETLFATTGGAQQQFSDIVWVTYKRRVPPKPGTNADDIVAKKEERITLACYQVLGQGRNIKLVSARDISFDMDLLDWTNNQPVGPKVAEIVNELRKEAEAEKKKKSGN